MILQDLKTLFKKLSITQLASMYVKTCHSCIYDLIVLYKKTKHTKQMIIFLKDL